MKIVVLPLTIGLAFAAGTAFAADRPTFAQLDSNKDGYLSPEEAAKAPQLDFASADKNHDGRLSPSEYDAGMEG